MVPLSGTFKVFISSPSPLIHILLVSVAGEPPAGHHPVHRRGEPVLPVHGPGQPAGLAAGRGAGRRQSRRARAPELAGARQAVRRPGPDHGGGGEQ